jgi:dipeptidyl aminopeptidase/acylaminoacyl peptidase
LKHDINNTQHSGISTSCISKFTHFRNSFVTGKADATVSPNTMHSESINLQRDIRKTDAFKQAENYFSRLNDPAFGKVSTAFDLRVSPDGLSIACTGSILDELKGLPKTRICVLSVAQAAGGWGNPADSQFEVVSRGPNNDKHARWSPDGRMLAFLSDREEKGVFKLYSISINTLGEASVVADIEGSINWFQWKPDGSQILIGMNGKDKPEDDLPDWIPSVKSGPVESTWKRLCIFDMGSKETKMISLSINVWEATWFGENGILAFISQTPEEDSWYVQELVSFDLTSSVAQPMISDERVPEDLAAHRHVLYKSEVQAGFPTCTPSGKSFAILEGVSSDPAPICGNIILGQSGSTKCLEIGMDVTYIEWRDETRLFCLGINGLDTVAGELILTDGGIGKTTFIHIWKSENHCGYIYPSGAFLGESFVVVQEGWTTPPEIAMIENGTVKTLYSFTHSGSEHLMSLLGSQKIVSWQASDGLEIQGLLQTPKHSQKPYPFLLNIHGGPTYSFRNRWPGNSYSAFLVSLGYAILSTNPRGSTGRGQKYAAMVQGDLGGAEAYDHLSACDSMIERGIADSERMGVIGVSHGGYMSNLLVTLDQRFKAAVPIAGMSNWLSMYVHLSQFNGCC